MTYRILHDLLTSNDLPSEVNSVIENSPPVNTVSDITSLLQFTIPDGKLFYPEPFIASPSYLHSDLTYLHIFQYWYWLWFLFIFLICFFFISFVSTVRWCSTRVRPRRETRGVSRSKCGGLITACVPVSWAVSIMVNESADATDLNGNFGTPELAVGLRTYQWGWEYYYPRTIDLNYNVRPSYSSFIGNSLQYDFSSGETLANNTLWRMYRNKAEDRVVTPAHLLLIPTDASTMVNFVNFKNIGLSTLQASSEFSKIRSAVKAYNPHLAHAPSNFVSKYHTLDTTFASEDDFLTTPSLGNSFASTLLYSASFTTRLETNLGLDSDSSWAQKSVKVVPSPEVKSTYRKLTPWWLAIIQDDICSLLGVGRSGYAEAESSQRGRPVLESSESESSDLERPTLRPYEDEFYIATYTRKNRSLAFGIILRGLWLEYLCMYRDLQPPKINLNYAPHDVTTLRLRYWQWSWDRVAEKSPLFNSDTPKNKFYGAMTRIHEGILLTRLEEQHRLQSLSSAESLGLSKWRAWARHFVKPWEYQDTTPGWAFEDENRDYIGTSKFGGIVYKTPLESGGEARIEIFECGGRVYRETLEPRGPIYREVLEYRNKTLIWAINKGEPDPGSVVYKWKLGSMGKILLEARGPGGIVYRVKVLREGPNPEGLRDFLFYRWAPSPKGEVRVKTREYGRADYREVREPGGVVHRHYLIPGGTIFIDTSRPLDEVWKEQ